MESIQLVIFGASGDLSQQKLFPALFNLEVRGKLPEDLQIVGASRRSWSDEDFRNEVKGFLQEFGKESLDQNAQIWDKFAQRLAFATVEFNNAEHFANLKSKLSNQSQGKEFRKILYYAVSPEFFEDITRNIGTSELLGDAESCSLCRVVVEKPFGHDLESAEKISETLSTVFDDSQIYRIDHVLSKNALADIISFRQFNYIFNRLFSKEFIDHIQITYVEDLGIGRRGAFYEKNGAIRDMVQSHILEALALIMAELPENITAEELHKRRAEVIASMDFQGPEDIVLGQYDSGEIKGEKVSAYTEETDVNPRSDVETYAAMRLTSSLENWQGVPIYLRTGKRLHDRYFDVHIVFKDSPELPQDSKNILSFRIAPNSGVNWRLWKSDLINQEQEMEAIDLTHCYKVSSTPDAYENLLREIMAGNNLFFISLEEIYASWKLIDRIKAIQNDLQLHMYAAGSYGPHAASELMKKYGKEWFDDNISDFCRI